MALRKSSRYGAADAAVSKADRVFLHTHNELRIDIDGAKVIHQHSHAQTMLCMKNAVEQRGFPRTQKAGNDGHGNGLEFRFRVQNRFAFIFILLIY